MTLGTEVATSSIAPGYQVAEVRAPDTGVSWLADVQDCADATMHLRLRAAATDALPRWPEGAQVDCTLSAGQDRVCAVATVLRQSEQALWLCVPAAWLRQDRRIAPRRPAGFAVSCLIECPERPAVSGECINITDGGMCLAINESLSLRQGIDLLFRIPGDLRPACAQGVVVWLGPSTGRYRLRVGIAFTHVLRDSRDRILGYCQGTESA